MSQCATCGHSEPEPVPCEWCGATQKDGMGLIRYGQEHASVARLCDACHVVATRRLHEFETQFAAWMDAQANGKGGVKA